MVDSVRRNIPVGIPYEIVIVDGGSTDSTQVWCRQQPDIKLIEHHELLGAIKAFDAGAKAAQGDYVILANDDIEFAEGSIIPALVYLEDDANLKIGAVAFMDNRPAPGYGDGYKVQMMQVQFGSAIKDMPYAQVGMFRRELGARCGWWGSDDAVMGTQGHTYGGDVFVSARIYEHGYTIATLDACKIIDHVTPDNLRERNYEVEQRNPGAYYKRFPQPPVFGIAGTPDTSARERLRVLYLNLHEPGFGKYKRGLRQGLQRAALVWEWDYLNEPGDLVRMVRQFQPHLLLAQMHSPDDVPLYRLAEARAECPGMVVANWNGDVYEDKLTSPKMLEYLKHIDLQLVVNADVLPIYAQHGIRAAYWQVGFEPVDYDRLPKVLAHDVVFLANCYSESRKELGQMLRGIDRVDVGLYGRGWQWGNGDSTYQFALSAALCQNAKICIGDNQYGKRGFVSNRVFETLAAGGFLLHQDVPGLEELTGLQDGVHYVAWTDADDLIGKVKYWLKPSNEARRQKIATAGRAFAQTHHSFESRVKQLLTEIIPQHEPIGA
jgi:hypothetical protein